MTNLPQTVTVETLPIISYQDQRVITTDLLAQCYGTDPTNIRTNHSSNAARFILGKHYFKLEGEELKQFKQLNCVSETDSVKIPKHTRNLTLWTERGAARHAKMLDTDQAWDVFEKLEDAYFGITETASSDESTDTITPSEQQLLSEFVKAKLEGHAPEAHGKAMAEIWSRVHRKFRVSKYENLPRTQLKDAIAYVQQMAVKALGQNKSETPNFPLNPQRALVRIEDGKIISLHDISGCSVVKTEGLERIRANIKTVNEQLRWLQGEASGEVLEKSLLPLM